MPLKGEMKEDEDEWMDEGKGVGKKMEGEMGRPKASARKMEGGWLPKASAKWGAAGIQVGQPVFTSARDVAGGWSDRRWGGRTLEMAWSPSLLQC